MVLNVSMALEMKATSHELYSIYVDVRLLVSLSKDLVYHGPSFKVIHIDAFMDLA